MEAWRRIGRGIAGCGQCGWGYKGALGIKDLVRLRRARHFPLQTQQNTLWLLRQRTTALHARCAVLMRDRSGRRGGEQACARSQKGPSLLYLRAASFSCGRPAPGVRPLRHKSSVGRAQRRANTPRLPCAIGHRRRQAGGRCRAYRRDCAPTERALSVGRCITSLLTSSASCRSLACLFISISTCHPPSPFHSRPLDRTEPHERPQ